MYFKNGNKYEGEYKNSLKEGRGTLYYMNDMRGNKKIIKKKKVKYIIITMAIKE